MISQKNYEHWAEYDARIENPATRDALNILRGAAAALDCFSVYPQIKGFLKYKTNKRGVESNFLSEFQSLKLKRWRGGRVTD